MTSDENSYLSNMDHRECHADALEPVILALVDLIMYPSNQSLFVDGREKKLAGSQKYVPQNIPHCFYKTTLMYLRMCYVICGISIKSLLKINA